MSDSRYKAVVIGVSAGGLQALTVLIPALTANFQLPLAIAQHSSASSDSYLAEYLNRFGSVHVSEAEDKEPMLPGHAYIAPPGYHLLIEHDATLSLSVDPRVNYCCPSVDVLFESAADAFGDELIGIILTGANSDGSKGLHAVKANGGYAIVQNPDTAESRYMPQATLAATKVDQVLELDAIAPLLLQLSQLRKGSDDVISAR